LKKHIDHFAILIYGPTEVVLFASNTCCRDGEIYNLRWDWEVRVPENFVKNGEERLVVLNRIAESVVNNRRGNSAGWVFTYRDKPIARMLNSAWLRARSGVGLQQVRVHDLKHTFGRHLQAPRYFGAIPDTAML
jgi:integrase